MRFSQISLDHDLELFFSGPSLEEGPLPALIYLSLSGPDSLCLDPFNQPVDFLAQNFQMRIFSLTIPAHEPPLDPHNAIAVWAEEFSRGNDVITPFIHKVAKAAEILVKKAIATSIGIAGLSRGGFLAAHAAAHSSHLKTILGFAPLTRLGLTKEFSPLSDDPRIKAFDLANLYEKLLHKSIRFYIGNRDVRVSTSSCFAFVQGLSEASFQHKIRSPHVELFITPSIGFQGHGTAKPIFEQGASWIAEKLGAMKKDG